MRCLMKSAILLYWSSLAATGERYTKAKTIFYVENFTFSFCCIYHKSVINPLKNVLEWTSVGSVHHSFSNDLSYLQCAFLSPVVVIIWTFWPISPCHGWRNRKVLYSEAGSSTNWTF
jgi:hypothetical protein